MLADKHENGTCPGPPECRYCRHEEEQIRAGLYRWDSGSLSTADLERILMDALADLWADAYRRGDSQATRVSRYLATVKRISMAATGVDIIR